MRRSTQLDGLPLATALALCAGLFWWVGRTDLQPVLLAGEARHVLARGVPDPVELLGAAPALQAAPSTPWGDRSLDELLERIFDPGVLREEVERQLPRQDLHGPEAPGTEHSGPGAPPEPRWIVLRDANGRGLAAGRTVNGVPNGPWSFRDPKGGRQAAGLFKSGVAVGRWLAWHEDGTPRSELNYELGKPEGLRVEWWPNGVKALEGQYTDGLRSGLWRTWHDTGALRSEGNYANGLREGAWCDWHPDGTVRGNAAYLEGRREGHWRQWHPGGALAEDGWFVDGQREGLWAFFTQGGERDRRSGSYVAGVRQQE